MNTMGRSILQTSQTGKDRKTKILLTFLPACCSLGETDKEVKQKKLIKVKLRQIIQ